MGNPKGKISKPYQIRITDNALQNIDDITGYIAFINHQPLNAIRIGDALFSTIDQIAQNPFAFRECEEIPTKNKIYRKAVCKSWLIVYRITPTEVIIMGVLYASRRASKIRGLRNVK
jgi:plasmid stabilization system protein ParE